MGAVATPSMSDAKPEALNLEHDSRHVSHNLTPLRGVHQHVRSHSNALALVSRSGGLFDERNPQNLSHLHISGTGEHMVSEK